MSAPPDIFLSYAREDAATARRFAENLEAQGFKVWWDATLRTGEAYDQVTEKALKEARAVVVLWSKSSVESRWVRAEATLADRNKTLVPVMIEACERPIMFELTHTAELGQWNGNAEDDVWRAFVADVRRFVGTESAPPDSPSATLEVRPVGQFSIVVLPFANMSSEAEQEYFADGITEDIITDLSKVSALAVISRNSAFTFKGKSVDVRQVSRQLNVTHVLEGSVRKAGNRVRITAQLIEGANDNHIWAERFDRDLSDIFALQDEVSQAIVQALKIRLLPEEKQSIEQRGTASTEAFDLFLRARALSQTYSPSQTLQSIEYFHQALRVDPGFGRAWAELAQRLITAPINLPESAVRLRQELEHAVARAVALAPDAWRTQVAIASLKLGERDWLAAEAACVKALQLAPPSEVEPSRQMAWFLYNVGRASEAVEHIRKVRRLEPLSLYTSTALQVFLESAGDDAEAQAEYERSRDLEGDHAIVDFWAFMRAWRLPGGMPAVKRQYLTFLAHENLPMPVHQELRDLLDEPAKARAVLNRCFEEPEYRDTTRTHVLSLWAGHFGDPDLAFALVRRRQFDLKDVNCGIWDSSLASIREDARFKDLLRELGLIDYYRSSGRWADHVRPVGGDDFECS